jgi:spore germination protein YaaH
MTTNRLHNNLFSLGKTLVLSALLTFPALASSQSVHQQQLLEQQQSPPSEDQLEAQRLETEGKLFPKTIRTIKSAESAIDKDFIVFGYLQNDDMLYHVRWNSLTHIGNIFTRVDNNGNFTNRSSTWDNRSSYLKAGGAADAAGCKVIMIVQCFDDSAGGAIEQVFLTPSKRTNLVNNVIDALKNDPGNYNGGVSMDIEFSWGANVRDGITAYIRELRQTMDTQGLQDKEVTIYTHPTFSSTRWNMDPVTGITPHINYMIQSGYSWASGTTPHAITDHNNVLTQTRRYFDAGLPPEKLVLALSTYGRRWTGTTQYNVAGAKYGAIGFTDGLYETTLDRRYSGPHDYHYVTGDEVAWHTYNNSGTNYTQTWDSAESQAYKIRNMLSYQDPTGVYNGRKLGGVAYWSLMWLAETSSYDPIARSSVSRTRTYPHIYQLHQEIFSPPGINRQVFESFEGMDFRWRDPNESPDTVGDTDSNSSRALVSTPGGTGSPISSTNAMKVTFDFESATNNKLFFRHEVLNSPYQSSVPDLNAVVAVMDSSTLLSAQVYTPSTYNNYSLRMIVVDGNGQLESSPPTQLNASGWREIQWDLTNPSNIFAYSTNERTDLNAGAFLNGNGALNTAGGGAKDIGFVGFILEGSGAINGQVTFDDLSYEHKSPGGDYCINEFSYAVNDKEFVEICGPVGTIPAGMTIRTFNADNGSVLNTFNLAGLQIPASGILAIGDPGVAGVQSNAGFSAGLDDLYNGDPTGIQIYSFSKGAVYDSVVYEAWGGLDDLIRQQTLGVTSEGYPWLGSMGTNPAVSFGRYPDGHDTDWNYQDFALQSISPGAGNGNSLPVYGTSTQLDFESPVGDAARQTFFWNQAGVVSSGVGVADSSGGNQAFFGDQALGAEGEGYKVTGELYIPGSQEPAQAIGVGFCGTQGAAFFPDAADNFGYENGYWLLYQNNSSVNINNGLGNHSGTFKFVVASNDNMDNQIVQVLGSATLSQVAMSAGNWTSFELLVDPIENTLTAKVNGNTVYTGPIPADAPISGAVMAGHREDHTGSNTASEGTWLDNLIVSKLTGSAATGFRMD